MEPISRRQAIAGVASGILIVAPDTAFGSQANSAVSYGVIGTGGRGVYVGTHMANVKGTKIAAICDIYPDRIDNAKTKIPGAQGARVYKDYHELLAQPDVDAVLITTPVYLHPEHFGAAVLRANTSIVKSPPAPTLPASNACWPHPAKPAQNRPFNLDSSSASAPNTSPPWTTTRPARWARSR